MNGSCCLCNHADFAIEPTEGGYLLEPLRDHHVDDLLVPLAEIGIEWHASAWAFYVPTSRLSAFRALAFVNAFRIRRRSA